MENEHANGRNFNFNVRAPLVKLFRRRMKRFRCSKTLAQSPVFVVRLFLRLARETARGKFRVWKITLLLEERRIIPDP